MPISTPIRTSSCGRAAKAKNTLQILSTPTSVAVEEVAKARETANPPMFVGLSAATIHPLTELFDKLRKATKVKLLLKGIETVRLWPWGRAVGIGRPYVWGLTAFGQDGIERVIDILRVELQAHHAPVRSDVM
jgi:hypothetical protein